MMNVLHRALFALRPPSGAVRRIGAIRDRLGPARSIVADHLLHQTLVVTDDHVEPPTALFAKMIEIGDRVAAPPVPVALDQVVASPHSIALRPRRASAQLRNLQSDLQRMMERWALVRGEWAFSPHVTLLYRHGDPFSSEIGPIAWESLDFVLIHSIVGRTRHIELGRWPLLRRQGELFH